MRIKSIEAENYRTLECLKLNFPAYYTAICGKNDSGKTNIIKAIRGIFLEDSFSPFRGMEEFSIKRDYTKWKDIPSTDRRMTIKLQIAIHSSNDAGLYEFLKTYLGLELDSEEILVNLEITKDSANQKTVVTIENKRYEDLKADEILKKLQTSKIVFFHNSTDPAPPFRYFRGLGGPLDYVSDEYKEQLEDTKKILNKKLKKIAKKQQEQVAELLGRLKEKYEVSLSFPTFDFDHLGFGVTLGDKKISVDLDDWGSGTRNRTLILLTLLRARQVTESVPSADKITPIIVIEEPESFLHPSAQAEFGRVLQDLAEEFKVQVISTTHSPYMLSIQKPDANILLERKLSRGKLRETQVTNTSGENWMIPFASALGINSEEFAPWRDLFFSHSDSILLVEGVIDKKYFHLLRESVHGANRLLMKGEIYSYGGCQNLKNSPLVKFITNSHKNTFITYDLDAEKSVEDKLISMGLLKNKNFAPIGLREEGKKSIEGLVPEHITSRVYGQNANLVTQSLSGSKNEKSSAKYELKQKIFEEFRNVAKPCTEDFKYFYQITKLINKALS